MVTVCGAVVITINIRKCETGHGILHSALIRLQSRSLTTSGHLIFSWGVHSISDLNPRLCKKSYLVSQEQTQPWETVQGLIVDVLVTNLVWFEKISKLTFTVLKVKSSFTFASWPSELPSSFKLSSIRHKILEELRISVVSLYINSSLSTHCRLGHHPQISYFKKPTMIIRNTILSNGP